MSELSSRKMIPLNPRGASSPNAEEIEMTEVQLSLDQALASAQVLETVESELLDTPAHSSGSDDFDSKAQTIAPDSSAKPIPRQSTARSYGDVQAPTSKANWKQALSALSTLGNLQPEAPISTPSQVQKVPPARPPQPPPLPVHQALPSHLAPSIAPAKRQASFPPSVSTIPSTQSEKTARTASSQRPLDLMAVGAASPSAERVVPVDASTSSAALTPSAGSPQPRTYRGYAPAKEPDFPTLRRAAFAQLERQFQQLQKDSQAPIEQQQRFALVRKFLSLLVGEE